MRWHENEPNPLLEFLCASDCALTSTQLERMYVRKFKGKESAFSRYLACLENDGYMMKIGKAAELLEVGRLGSSVDTNKRLFYARKGQLGVWFERNARHSYVSLKRNGTPVEKKLKVFRACDEGLECKPAAEMADVSAQTTAELYREWKAVPTEVFDGAFGTDGGVTFTEVKRVVERRLDDSVPDPLLKKKLDYMILLGYCETVKMDEKTYYSAKEPLPRPKRR